VPLTDRLSVNRLVASSSPFAESVSEREQPDNRERGHRQDHQLRVDDEQQQRRGSKENDTEEHQRPQR